MPSHYMPKISTKQQYNKTIHASIIVRCLSYIWSDAIQSYINDLVRDNLRSVHWLRVPQRSAYKLCLIAYKALNDHRILDYISNFCVMIALSREQGRLCNHWPFNLEPTPSFYVIHFINW